MPKPQSQPQLVVVKLTPLLVSRSEAAKLLDCGESTIRLMVKRGHLTEVRVGSRVKITTESIQDYISTHSQQGPRAPALRPHEIGPEVGDTSND